MIHIITLCNNVNDIENIKNNINKAPKTLRWHLFINNCSDEDKQEFVEEFEGIADVVLMENNNSFSSNRAEAFITVASQCPSTDWIMDVDADDTISFGSKFSNFEQTYAKADVVINPSYTIVRPNGKKEKVTVTVPKTLDEYLASREFIYTVQFIFKVRVINNVYRIRDTNVSSYDEIIPQIRLFSSNYNIMTCDNTTYRYYYYRVDETLSNNGKMFIFLLNLMEVTRREFEILESKYYDAVVDKNKTLHLSYILRKAAEEDKPLIEQTFNKLVEELY